MKAYNFWLIWLGGLQLYHMWKATQHAGNDEYTAAIYYMLWAAMFFAAFVLIAINPKKNK